MALQPQTVSAASNGKVACGIPNLPSPIIGKSLFEVEDFLGKGDEFWLVTVELRPQLNCFKASKHQAPQAKVRVSHASIRLETISSFIAGERLGLRSAGGKR